MHHWFFFYIWEASRIKKKCKIWYLEYARDGVRSKMHCIWTLQQCHEKNNPPVLINRNLGFGIVMCPGLQMRLNWIGTKPVRRPHQATAYNYISKTVKRPTHLGSLRKSGTESRSVVPEKGLTVKGVWETKHAQGQGLAESGAWTLAQHVGISRAHDSAICLTFEGPGG